ncbi:hypothetical protein XENOCAPTIV_029670 [Xenoophorus captivus]|uniref:Uncharacterized protein n=1 Tax=Xenoophorus captivus TaxID=1517983 RepID=A0ABV0S482_9TELE
MKTRTTFHYSVALSRRFLHTSDSHGTMTCRKSLWTVQMRSPLQKMKERSVLMTCQRSQMLVLFRHLTIPPHFRLPWNHDLQEEPLECQEENSLRGTSPRYQESVELDPAPSTSGPCISRKRTREGDAEEELPAKRISR